VMAAASAFFFTVVPFDVGGLRCRLWCCEASPASSEGRGALERRA
jgi:hypothetical protein